MVDAAAPPDADAGERRFALSVWPQTPSHGWRALMRAADDASAVRFDRPMDLVLYLTELSTGPDGPPRGLR